MLRFDITSILVRIVAVVLAMSVHEIAHALVSYWMGDPTAKLEGRLSLNPFRHIDWLGVLCLMFFGLVGPNRYLLIQDIIKIKKRELFGQALPALWQTLS